jgi:hypothetical protein
MRHVPGCKSKERFSVRYQSVDRDDTGSSSIPHEWLDYFGPTDEGVSRTYPSTLSCKAARRITLLQQVRIEANNYAGLKLRAVLETAPYDHVVGIAQYYDDLRANGVSDAMHDCLPYH